MLYALHMIIDKNNQTPIDARATMAANKRPAALSAEVGNVIDRILDSAENVLRSQGYAGFSTRRVAQEAGMALGNLTYHFPSKPGLVRALIDRLMTRYLGRFEETLEAPGEGIESLVRWLLAESIKDEASWLFREIWAMSLHDSTIRDCLDDFYDTLMSRVAKVLVEAHPEADPGDISALVHFIALMSEGGTVIYGTRRPRTTSYQQMIDLAVRLIPAIAPGLADDAQAKAEGG